MASLCDVWHALGLCADHHVESQSNRCRYHGTNAVASCPFSRWCSASSVLYDKKCEIERLGPFFNDHLNFWDHRTDGVWGNLAIEKTIYRRVYQWCHRGSLHRLQPSRKLYLWVSQLTKSSFLYPTRYERSKWSDRSFNRNGYRFWRRVCLDLLLTFWRSASNRCQCSTSKRASSTHR